ncbi:unnamed protein product [Urochloa humidicola]
MHNLPEPGFSCFDVLRFGTSGKSDVATWQSLPPPPFIRDPLYDPAFICSYTVVDDGHTICISSGADGVGTYCFDTVESKWKHAGNWVLPFDGRAEYIPELKLWLGFSPSRPHYLCGTSDLSSMAMDWPPKLQVVWRDLSMPDKWSATRINLINLGAGRFCIVKVFEVKRCAPESAGDFDDDWNIVEDEHAILTGIEICSSSVDQYNNLQELKVFKHKSILHKFADDVIEWAL